MKWIMMIQSMNPMSIEPWTHLQANSTCWFTQLSLSHPLLLLTWTPIQELFPKMHCLRGNVCGAALLQSRPRILLSCHVCISPKATAEIVSATNGAQIQRWDDNGYISLLLILFFAFQYNAFTKPLPKGRHELAISLALLLSDLKRIMGRYGSVLSCTPRPKQKSFEKVNQDIRMCKCASAHYL
jgi:hypothetical protein